VKWISDELAAWEAAGLLRHPRVVDTASAPEVSIDGRSVVLLCTNNYLGLADDVRVREAAATAARTWGAGTGASRLVSGTSRVHHNLEAELALFEGAEEAVLFSSGYLANIGAITTLAGPGDVVFSDELNHASIVDACRLSKASIVVYPHKDVDALAGLLAKTPARRRIVVTDTVFSMDGDLAPLGDLVALCEDHDAILVVDEAHATGVLGTNGAGAVEELGLQGRVPVVVGTLSKSLGSAGGYVATTKGIATLMRNRARSHVFDTAPPAAVMAAASEALRIVGAEPWRRERVRALATDLATELRTLGFDAGHPAAAVVPVLVGDAREAVALSTRLLEAGVFCPAIRPPSVAEGTSRLRVTVMATHTDDHIARALDAFAGRSTSARPKLRRDVFVTGTDTGVGKTVVVAALARTLSKQGLNVAIFKPLQTGTIDGDDDARVAKELTGCDAFTGAAFADPLAPSVAARLADDEIDVFAIVTRFVELKSAYDVVIVEGAGGLLVPIDDHTTMAELARELRLPVLIVCRPALGTLNHTALTVETARARGLEIAGLVISGFPSAPSLAEATNPSELEKLCRVPLAGVVPALASIERSTLADAPEWFGLLLGGTFDRDAFLASLQTTALL
jgi:8-amino-7-oxononanoate synthase/dethiobiotin synthase